MIAAGRGAAFALLTAAVLVGTVATPARAQTESDYLVSVPGDVAEFRMEIAAAGGTVEEVFGSLDVLAVTLPDSAAASLVAETGATVEPSFQARTSAEPSFGLDRIDQRSLPLSQSYARPSTGMGEGVDVYIMDTGIRADHQQLSGRVKAGFTAFNDGLGTADCHGHGTHVAGTVAGTQVGVAPLAKVIPVRVLNCSGTTTTGFEFTAGLDWIIQHHQAGQPAVLNMSFGGAGSTIIDEAVAKVRADGIVVVAAAGNENADACTVSPARAPAALAVAASTISDARAFYSNWGTCVDLFAPGGDGSGHIRSAGIGTATELANKIGTSMAAPHVSGAAARYLSVNPATAPSAVQSTILGSATPDKITGVGAGTPNRLLFVGEWRVDFTDVQTLGFAVQVRWLGERGVSRGWLESDGSRTYRPLESVKRDAMAAFLYRLKGEPTYTPPAVPVFSDVPAQHPFYKEISWLEDQGISNGWAESDGSRTYRPNEPVKRDAMAAFLYRYEGVVDYEPLEESTFKDMASTSLFYPEISWLAAQGISTGWVEADGARAYRPAAEITREHMAAFMYRLVNGA